MNNNYDRADHRAGRSMTMTGKNEALIAELRALAAEVHDYSTRGAEAMNEAADALEAATAEIARLHGIESLAMGETDRADVAEARLAALTTPQEARSAAKVVPVSYEASASCSHGVCPSGCSHLMWACAACSCEGGWGASRDRIEELAAEHVCVAVAPAPQEVDARERLHAKCDCVPDLGPAHCHLCGNEQGEPVQWAECSAVRAAAPEPEWEWTYRARLQSCGFVTEGYVSAEYAMEGLRSELEEHPYLVMDDTAIVERTRVREWLPVEGEKP